MNSRRYFIVRCILQIVDGLSFVGLFVLLLKVLKVPEDLPVWRAFVAGVLMVALFVVDRVFTMMKEELRQLRY